MPSLLKKFYNPVAFDALFGTAGIVGLLGLFTSAGNPFPPVIAASDPMAKGGAAIGTLVACGIIAIGSTRFDQKMADDFLFQSLTKSAFIGMMMFILAAAFWELLFNDRFGGLSSYAMVAMAVGAWALAWFYTRIRGTRA